MAKRLIPLLDRVLVEKLTAPSKSVGGVLLPDSATSKVEPENVFRQNMYHCCCTYTCHVCICLQYNEGRVLAVGQGRRTLTSGETIPVAVKEGDKVLLPDYGGTQLKLDGKE